jgi:cysteine desulfurase
VDKEGLISTQSLKQSITKETSIISIMWANNEIGAIEPIEDLAQLAHDAGIYFHSDAIQIPGKIKIDLSQVQTSTLSISGHKFYAPKGIGALYVRKGVNLMPLIFGGGQERALFPGTQGVANIVAIGQAAELAAKELDVVSSHLKQLQKIFHQELKDIAQVKITGPQDLNQRLPGHLSLVIPGVEGESLVLRADLQGVGLSSGSACHLGIIEPSPVLRAVGLSIKESMGSLRISASAFNTQEECQQAAKILSQIFQTCPHPLATK